MSFILEALRKSESDRQRLGSVAIADLPIARRHRGQPWWVFALSALLLINLVVLGVVLLRDKPAPTNNALSQSMPAGAPTAATSMPPESQRVVPPAPVAGSNELQAAAAQVDYETVPRSELEIANAAASVPDGPTLVRATDSFAGNASGSPSGTVATPDRDAVNAPGAQELRLDLHVYSVNPRERFVLINMRRYIEGQQLPNGATVEQIVPDGVLLHQNGTRYKLDRR